MWYGTVFGLSGYNPLVSNLTKQPDLGGTERAYRPLKLRLHVLSNVLDISIFCTYCLFPFCLKKTLKMPLTPRHLAPLHIHYVFFSCRLPPISGRVRLLLA